MAALVQNVKRFFLRLMFMGSSLEAITTVENRNISSCFDGAFHLPFGVTKFLSQNTSCVTEIT